MNPLNRDWFRRLERWRKPRVLIATGLIIILGTAWWWLGGDTTDPGLNPPSHPSPTAAADTGRAPGKAPEAASTATQYVCPMMHIPPTDQPGTCPVCGMELVPVGHDRSSDNTNHRHLALTPHEVKLADIRVAPVQRRFVTAEVRLFGRIDYDPSHTTEITAFMPGVIDRLYIRRAGQFVRWGDPLFDLYSSDLLETQQQLTQALKYAPGFFAFQGGTPHVAQDMPIQERKSAGGARQTPEMEEALRTITALRHKLSILGLPKRDIDEFMKVGEATGVATVYAPMYGQVTVQSASEGSYVNRGTPVMTIADPQYVWLRMDAYEMDYAWIRKGQEVDFTTEAYPGETFKAQVVYIDPVFDAPSRSFRVGAISTEDRGGRLKAGMLVRAVLQARLDAEGRVVTEADRGHQPPLVIPASAPLITGKRAVVYVANADRPGVFEGREVVLGPRASDGYVVREGLAEGELVVVNGSFKIDSALQIQARPSFMSPAGQPMGGAHAHGHGEEAHAAASPPHPLDPPPEGAAPSPEPVSATAHQRPGDSSAMHEHYMQQRQESRKVGGQSAGDIEAKDSLSGPGDDDAGRSIRRRRPGNYGDQTRPRIARPAP